MNERLEIITAAVRAREAQIDAPTIRGLEQVEIAVGDLLRYRITNELEPEGTMQVGEPRERGGDGSGNTPLSHFLAGAGACLLNQFVRVAIADGLALTFVGASVRGEFRRNAGGGFERMRYVVRAKGTIDAHTGAALIERSTRLCYIHATLVKSVTATTILEVDGRELARHVDGPGARRD